MMKGFLYAWWRSSCERWPGFRAVAVALCFVSVMAARAVEADGVSVFTVGKYLFKIGGDVGDGQAWLVGVKPGAVLEGEVTLPGSATVNGVKYTVTKIGGEYGTDRIWWYDYEPAIHDQPAITRLNIPSTIKEIVTFEFPGCTGITEFHVNAANTEFKDENGILFRRNSLNSNAVVSYWDLFRMPPATKKTKYTIPADIVNICNCAFADNKTIKTIILKGNTNFASYWAARNLGIREIDVSAADSYDTLNGVVYYSDSWAVNGVGLGKYGGIITCPPALAMDKLTLPASLKYVSSGAFIGTHIAEIEFPESSTVEMGWFVFYGSAVKSLKLNAGLVDNHTYSFYGLCLDCKSLESVDLTGSTGKELIIADHMFRGCESLRSLNIASDNVDLRHYAFYGCRSLTSFPFAKLTAISGYHEGGYQFAYSGLTSARIPSFCRFVPQGMFLGAALESVDLNPSGKNNITEICSQAFKDCRLEEVDLARVRELDDGCFVGNPLKKVVFHDDPYFSELQDHTIKIDRAFTPSDNTWFYLVDNMVNWIRTYDWNTGSDDMGMQRATYVSSERRCVNVPDNFKTVYGPAGCHNASIGWANGGTGEVREMFTMTPVEGRLAVVIEQSPESASLSFEVTAVKIGVMDATCNGNEWSVFGTDDVEGYVRTVFYTVNGVEMETRYPAGYSTGLDAVAASVAGVDVVAIHRLDGTSAGTNPDALTAGIYMVTYSNGTTQKFLKR